MCRQWSLIGQSFLKTIRKTSTVIDGLIEFQLYCLLSLIVHISLTAATATVEGKMSKSLKKVLKKIVAKDIHQELAIADAKLGGVIKVSKYS